MAARTLLDLINTGGPGTGSGPPFSAAALLNTLPPAAAEENE
jgi:hypothetical protein